MKKITLLLSAMLFAMMSFAATTVTMDFTSKAGLEKLGIAYPADSTGTEGAYQTELVAGQAYTQDGVSLTATHGSTPTRVWLGASGSMDLRHYKTGVLTFAAPAGKVILKVKLAGGNVAGFADVTGGVWTGEAATVALTANADASTIKISTIEVTYGESGETPEPEDPKETELVIPEEAKAWNIPAEAIDVLQAREICAGLASGATTGTKYYVMGYVKKIHDKHASGVSGFGNAQFFMENVKGANSSEDFMAYQVYGLNGEKITDPNVVAVGDFVVIYGELTNYQGNTYETVGKGAAYIWNSTNPLIAGDPKLVTISDLVYANAYYTEEDGVGYYNFDLYKDYNSDTEEYTYPRIDVTVAAKSKTALNGTYELLEATYYASASESVAMGETAGTLTVKNVDTEGNYSFRGSFVGTDGKTYKFDQKLKSDACDLDNDEEPIELEDGQSTPGTDPVIPGDAIVFDADADMGNASLDAGNQTPYSVSKGGVTLDVTKGIIGVYNNENHYRVYKSQTLTLTSTVGNIVKVEFTCTAEGDAQYGPGCFTVTDGEYNYSGPVGTWTGNADVVTFTASSNQVRATQIVVTLAKTTDVENVTVGATPVKVIENGQLMIMRGENVYTILGAQVK